METTMERHNMSDENYGFEDCPMCQGKGFHEGENLPEDVTGSPDNLDGDVQWIEAPEGATPCYWCQGVGERLKVTIH